MPFYKPDKLPKLMVAPNGARPMKKDHEAIPLTINEIVNTGKACFAAGAEAIHFHTRNNKGEHVLDSGLCKETLSELQKNVPKMHLQITTEAIGKYSPEEMRKLAYDVMPPGISIGIREMIPSRKPENEDIKIYQKLIEAGTKVQHICYEPEDIDLLSNADWAVCAFAKEEISCLKTAIKLGGKIRVGFENSFLMPDGSVAPNNETKVKAANNLFD